MSRSAVFRHNARAIYPQNFGKELGATAVLVGKITSRPATLGMEAGLCVPPRPARALEPSRGVESSGGMEVGGGVKPKPVSGLRTVLGINVELVEVATGWQIWGESFDCESKDLLQIQDAIIQQLLVNLKLKLTGEEEKRVTERYTENAEAYQAYLEGRYHWSRYTRKGIETAIKNFRRAIELDSNYALAYAAIVDCYLRLATNYLPPDGEATDPVDDPSWSGSQKSIRESSCGSNGIGRVQNENYVELMTLIQITPRLINGTPRIVLPNYSLHRRMSLGARKIRSTPMSCWQQYLTN